MGLRFSRIATSVVDTYSKLLSSGSFNKTKDWALVQNAALII